MDCANIGCDKGGSALKDGGMVLNNYGYRTEVEVPYTMKLSECTLGKKIASFTKFMRLNLNGYNYLNGKAFDKFQTSSFTIDLMEEALAS